MKKIILLFILFTKFIFAQDDKLSTIKYLDSLNNPATKESFFKYQVFKKENPKAEKYLLQTFDKEDHLIESHTYSDKEGTILNGEAITYYKNGNKKTVITYVEKTPSANSFSWYENGNLREESEYLKTTWADAKFHKVINYWDEKGNKTVTNGNGFTEYKDENSIEKGNYKDGYKDGKWTGESIKSLYHYEETYTNGELVKGISTESDGSKNEYTLLEAKPEPKKGLSDFYKYIMNNFSATDLAYKNKVKGKIIVGFVVDKDGKITDIKVIKSLGNGLDEEAIKVLSKYGEWIPALQKGRKVRCSFVIPITVDYSK